MSDGPDDGEFEFSKPEGRDIEILRVSLEQARATLEGQQRSLADMDNKAMRSVRITLVTLGILFSAATFSNAGPFVNRLTIWGGAFLTLSIIAGIITYSISRVEHGIGTDYLNDVRKNSYTEEEWLELVLAGYEEMCSSMRNLNKWERRLMSATLAFLAIGILFISIGIYCGILRVFYQTGESVRCITIIPKVITS